MDYTKIFDMILENFKQMLQDRNYTNISDKIPIVIKKNQYEDFYITLNDTNNKNILALILFPNDVKNKKKKIINYIFEELALKYDKYIILYFFNFMKKLTYDIPIEYFSYTELIINVTRHELQPIFKKLDSIDNIKNPKLLPKLLTSDPICKYYGFKNNDIILVDDDGVLSLRIVENVL